MAEIRVTGDADEGVDALEDLGQAARRAEGDFEDLAREARQLEDELEGAARDADDLGDELDSVEGSSSGLSAGLGVLGGAVAAAGITDFIFEASEAALELNNMSRETGINVETLSALKAAAEQNGVEFGALAPAIATVADKLVDATAGGEGSIEQFEALGLEISSLRDLSPEQLFATVAEAVVGIEDPTLRAGIATQFLGEDWRAMVGIFDDGELSLEQVIEQQRRLGTVMDEGSIQAAVELNEKWEILKGNLQSTAIDTLPLLVGGLERIAALLQNIRDLAEDPIQWFGRGFEAGNESVVGLAAVNARNFFFSGVDPDTGIGSGTNPDQGRNRPGFSNRFPSDEGLAEGLYRDEQRRPR